MDDMISRQSVNDAMDRTCDLVCEYSKEQRYTMCGACPLGCAFDAVADVPSAQRDTVKVVRCKDCKHHDGEKPGRVYCPDIIKGWISEYFFCAGGERRE